MKVDGKQYTSNHSKLLHHLDKLKAFQEGQTISPIMFHLALTNKCNLNCEYCCYGERDNCLSLPTNKAIHALDSFSTLGTKGVEFTGGGDPLLHKSINNLVSYAKLHNYDIGLITNGIAYDKFKEWDKLDWIRISSHALNYDVPYLKEKFHCALRTAKHHRNVDLGSVHIYTGNDKNLENVVKVMDQYKIPTRITPDLTKSVDWIKENMPKAAKKVENSNYCFVSDFNIKYDREHNNCYLHLLKPFVYPDGNVYNCPGASFSPESYKNVGEQYKVCSIEDIVKTYLDVENLKPRQHDCGFCKYQHQNDLMYDVQKPVKDINFA